MDNVGHIDLCSGIGGFSLAASWLGWRTVAHSEVEPYCCKVYHRHFPESVCLGNAKEIDWHEARRKYIANGWTAVVLTAGFPCQGNSTAGQRKGSADERDLWPECARAVRELRPDYALFENVPGALTVNGGRYFERILSDLAAVGYDAEWQIISAADVGALHLRKRIWIVAYRRHRNGRTGHFKSHAKTSSHSAGNTGAEERVMADPSILCQGPEQEYAGSVAFGYCGAARDGETCGEGEGTKAEMADSKGERERSIQQHGQRNGPERAVKMATPSARDWRSGKASAETMNRNARPLNEQMTAKFSTPQSRDYRTGQAERWSNPGRSRNLNDQMTRMLPTPHSNCHTGPGTQGRQGGANLQTEMSGKLSCCFVTYLMGYPIGWLLEDDDILSVSEIE
jgi:DNA-cytosine methyltransferase